MSDLRTVDVYENGEWINMAFSELKKGMAFRMFEPNDEQVVDEYGNTEWIAISNPYKTKNEYGDEVSIIDAEARYA